MTQANHVARSSRPVFQRFNRVFHAARCEILEEGISSPKRQKSQRGAAAGYRLRIQAVHDFIGRAVPSDGEKIPKPVPVSSANEFSRFSRAAGPRDFQLQTGTADAIQ